MRLYAEDPSVGFLPQTGTVGVFEAAGGPGVRVDSGIASGAEVGLFYDPMLAKVCAAGADRDQARRRLLEALRETVLLGVNTNQSYLAAILEQEAFAAGAVHTGFIEEHMIDATAAGPGAEALEVLLGAAAVVFSGRVGNGPRIGNGVLAGLDPVWSALGAWRIGSGEGS